jgi:hypothetical protein
MRYETYIKKELVKIIMKRLKKILMAVGIIPFILGIFVIALNPINFQNISQMSLAGLVLFIVGLLLIFIPPISE